MAIFAKRPLRLRSGFVASSLGWGILWMVVGVGAGAGYLGWQASAAMRMIEAQQVWDHGVPAANAGVSGRAQSHYFIFTGYDLDVSYSDARGGYHTEELDFSTFLGGPDEDVEPIVRVDPSDPSRFALSWEVDSIGAQVRALVFMVVVGLLIAGAFVFLGWKLVDRLRVARAVVRDGRELVCVVESVHEQVVNGRPNGHLIYHYEVRRNQVDGLPEEASGMRQVIMKRKAGAPLSPLSGNLVVLVSPAHPKEPLVIRDDFYPLALDASEEAAARSEIDKLAKVEPIAQQAFEAILGQRSAS